MRMRFLGKTGLQVSELCLGTANFGATGIYAITGHISQSDADSIVQKALDSGINFFNCAERYSYGIAEEVLGKALKDRRQEAIIITKINPARVPGPNDGGLSRKHIIEGCNGSLKRLKTDYIDIYEIHEFDEFTPLEVSLRALDDLVRSGKVRYIGCSNFTGWQIMKALGISSHQGLESFSTSEIRYSLASRIPEYEIIPACIDQGVAVLAWGALHGGLLSGKYKKDKPFPANTRFDSLGNKFMSIEEENLYELVDMLEVIAKNHNKTISQAALNYLLRKPGIASLIIGLRTEKQLDDNLGATDWEMDPEEIEELDRISMPIQDYPYYTWDPEKNTYIKH